MEAAPAARRPPKRRPIKVAVLYNVDYEDNGPEGDPGYAARADVCYVATSIAEELDDGAHEVHLVPVDGDMHMLRSRLAEIEPDCAFNLCESLAGDARLESAVPLLLELMRIPYTGSAPEALCAALYKDRVKDRLAAAGVSTPSACVMQSGDDAFSLPFPVIVKPLREDGSVGIDSRIVVYDARSLRERADAMGGRQKQPFLVGR
jgi:D-alanine-D-alanine ligase